MFPDQNGTVPSIFTMTQKVEFDRKTIVQAVVVLVLVAVVMGLAAKLAFRK